MVVGAIVVVLVLVGCVVVCFVVEVVVISDEVGAIPVPAIQHNNQVISVKVSYNI